MSEKRIRIRRALRELQHPRSPDAERRRQDARVRILEATIELVLSKGWHGLTMDGIASRARVGKQTIYRWWPSKGAVLFDAVVADGFQWPAFPDTGDFKADLESILRNLVAEFSEPSFDSLMRAILAGAQEDEHLARELDRHLSAAPVDAAVNRIESARESGQIAPLAEAATLADIVYGAVFRRWLLGTGKLDFEFADAVALTTIRAVAPP